MAFDAMRGEVRRRREDEVLAGCDSQQTLAITTPAMPLCVVAGAGSGKTRVLTRRIAWRIHTGSALANRVLALTFTRKAAGELRSRLYDLGLPEDITAGTFHAIALAELKRLAAERGERPPVVLSSKARLLGEVLRDRRPRSADREAARFTSGGRRHGAAGSFDYKLLGELAQDIEWAKARCLTPSQFSGACAATGRRPAVPPDDLADIWQSYEQEKSRRGVLDFEDLLTRCRQEMIADAEFAASARFRYCHLFVDEYQDVNTAQQRLLDAWLGPRDDLCVVGDARQAIYAWNGSNPAAIAEFANDYPGATILELRTNYRSTNEVLHVAGAVLGRSHEPPPAGGPCPDGPVPTITCYEDDAEEATGIAAAARLAHRPGRSWSQIAVLTRTNGQLPIIEAALQRAGIPTRMAGSAHFFSKASVRAAAEQAAALPNASALRAIAHDFAEAAGRPVDPQPDLAVVADLIDDYLAEDPSPSGRGWRSWLDMTMRDRDLAGRSEGVELATFHRAKGLEWPVVFLAGLEDGYVPIAHALSQEAIAEERRLLYVACTRAGEELHCSWAKLRRFTRDSAGVERSPSQWLTTIQAAHHDLMAARRASVSAAARGLAASRQALGLS
jgi:DNA helicase-2/ATP-dependent DNA helicase PcrA